MRRVILVGAAWMLATAVGAVDINSETASPSDAFRDDFGESEYEETHRWREQRLALPAAPDGGNLVPIVESADVNFTYFLDSASLQIGADKVTRAVLVSRSASGYDNAEFVGVHCANEAFRRYAYLDSYAQWKLYPQRDWADPPRGVMTQLVEYYLCDHHLPLPPPRVLQRLGGERSSEDLFGY